MRRTVECWIPVKQDRAGKGTGVRRTVYVSGARKANWCAAICWCGEPRGGVRRTVRFRKARLCGRKRCASYCA